jgi:sulfite dehydrogenase (quinone) subunit SoeC
MHPAFSVIFFTAVSGAGYGLLFLLGIAFALGFGVDRNEAMLVLIAGVAFAAAGLTSSMLHLGQPLRAWRAFSQWRSSWLSREGVAAIFCFVPAFAIGVGLLFGFHPEMLRILGFVLATLCIVTVFCTARIYTSLKTIRAWHNAYVLPIYLSFGLLSGSAWFWLFHAAMRSPPEMSSTRVLLVTLAFSAIACVVLKIVYWRFIDMSIAPSTVESATGLGRFGAVTSVESPHTEENYLTREMGFVLARKHSRRLQSICLTLIGALPIGSCLIAIFAALPPPFEMTLAVMTTVCITAGIFVERWLFFAQAKHVVMLYYARSARQNV